MDEPGLKSAKAGVTVDSIQCVFSFKLDQLLYQIENKKKKNFKISATCLVFIHLFKAVKWFI